MVYISKTVAIIGIIGIALAISLVGIIVGVTTRKCTEFEAPPTAPSTTTPQPETSSATTAASTTEPTPTNNSTDTEEPSPATTAEPDRDIRLPTALAPSYYSLYLKIDLEPNFSTAGSWVTITVKCVSETNKIVLHAFKSLLTIDPSKTIVRKPPTDEITINSQEYIEEKEFYVVTLINNLEENAEYEIYFEFSGEIPETTNGLYRSSYQESDGSIKWLASTHLQAPHARKIFPVFDEPQFKAVFSVTLVHHKNYHSLSNNDIISSNNVIGDADWVEDHYGDTPIMSSYLLCFVVSEFLSLEGATPRGIEVRAWARPELIDQAEYALNTTAIILEGFEDYFGIPYTNDLNKTELIALPVFSAGAMENWGLVVYREVRMLHESGETPADEMKHICRVIAHEIMHQYLGNLVTCEWWSHLWLNEGFSRYLEYVGCDFAEPEWRMADEIIVVHMMPSAFRYDALATSHPIINDAVTNTEVRAIFDSITYNKGGCIFQMIQALLGEKAWKLSLTDYLKTFAYENAVTDDLWDSMQKVIDNEGIELDGKTIKELMDPWTLQMGYPLLNVIRQYGDSKIVTITQEHFLLDPTAEVPPSDFSYLWEVPVFFTTQNDVNWESPDIIWMHQQPEVTATISADDNEWFIANAGVKGFYRVMYDDNNWELINKQLKEAHEVISVRNRAQLFEDAFELAKILKIEQVKALQLLEFLDKEVEYLPWHAALGKLNYLDLMLGKTGTYGALKKFMVSQTEDMYNAIGWEEYPDKELQKRLFQVDITAAACKYGNSDCEGAALAQFQEWMDTGENNIAVDRQTSVYCTAIAKGDHEQWEFAWDQFIHTSDPADETKLLEAMACSRQTSILQMYLERVLDGQIKSTDGDKVINYVGLNVAGNYLVWDFIRRHWDYLYETYRGSTSAMDRIVRGATDRFSTEYDLSQVEAFRATIADRGGNMAYWTGAVENIHTNILWRAENDETIKEWLESMNTRAT